MTIRESTKAILLRELQALKREIDAYPDDASIWSLPDGISNSAGTLTLHLAGNLQSFVGAQLGDTGYRRDRRAEFENRDISRVELEAQISRAIEAVDATLGALPPERLTTAYPLTFGGKSVNAGDFLIHVATHLAFHLGQIDYHRRLVTGDNVSIAPLAIPDLASFGRTE